MRILIRPSLFLVLCCLLMLTEAKTFNFTVWQTEEAEASQCDQLCNRQFELLKYGNEIVKFRLETLENNMMRQIENIAENFAKLQRTLGQQQQIEGNREDMQGIAETEKRYSKPMPLEDMKNFDSSFYDIITKHTTENQLQKDISEIEKQFMTNINGQEPPKICLRHDENSFMCSDIILPTSCADPSPKACWDNKCYIQNPLNSSNPFWVSCNDTIDGGGWTVIQRRLDGSVDFDRNWSDYKDGFGDLDGDFWIGLDKLHALTEQLGPVELYVQLSDSYGVETYARYDSFAIGGEWSKYVLKSLGAFSGTAEDSLSGSQNMKFSTVDQDNDHFDRGNCAKERRGGWWYSYDNCGFVNLNGAFSSNNIYWDESMVPMYFVQLMIRPR